MDVVKGLETCMSSLYRENGYSAGQRGKNEWLGLQIADWS